MSQAASRPDPLVSDVAKAAFGFAGLAMCITLMYLGMRAVMDIGGACAEGGPYVPRVECPDVAPIALIAGMFGWFLFAGIATLYGTRIGGIWAAAPVLAWSGLFLALGWNFLSYGVLNPPGEEGIVWGWAICAVVFMLMGGVPLLGLAGFAGLGGPGVLYGNSRPPRPASPSGTFPLGPTPGADEDMQAALRTALAAAAAAGATGGIATASRGATGGASTTTTTTTVFVDGEPVTDPERAAALAAIATDLTSAVNEALTDLAEDAPADPLARAMGDDAASGTAAGAGTGTDADAGTGTSTDGDAGTGTAAPAVPGARGATDAAGTDAETGSAAPAFAEGTQALLDRLERLADLRDRGLLAPDEYETAKETIVKELEGRA